MRQSPQPYPLVVVVECGRGGELGARVLAVAAALPPSCVVECGRGGGLGAGVRQSLQSYLLLVDVECGRGGGLGARVLAVLLLFWSPLCKAGRE